MVEVFFLIKNGCGEGLGLLANGKTRLFEISGREEKRGRGLQAAFLAVAVVSAVDNDDVVEEVEAHGVAGGFDLAGDAVVLMTGLRVVAGVVVDERKGGGVAKQCFAYNDAHVDGRIAQPTVGNTEWTDEAVVLIHQQDPRFLYVEVLHDGVHIVVDGSGTAEVWSLAHFLSLASFTEFTGGEQADGLSFADAVVAAEVADA